MKNPRICRRIGLRKRSGKATAGFSLVEGLVAMAILLTVVIGVVPLFAQSMVNTSAGWHYTQASNYARGGFEILLQLPLSNERLEVPEGALGLATIELFSGVEPTSTALTSREAYSLLGSFSMGILVSSPPDYRDLIEAATAAGGGITDQVVQQAAWFRLTTVRQFQISSLSDGLAREKDEILDEAEQMPGGVTPGNVQLKKIDIWLIPRGEGNIFGRGRLQASVIKAF